MKKLEKTIVDYSRGVDILTLLLYYFNYKSKKKMILEILEMPTPAAWLSVYYPRRIPAGSGRLEGSTAREGLLIQGIGIDDVESFPSFDVASVHIWILE